MTFFLILKELIKVFALVPLLHFSYDHWFAIAKGKKCTFFIQNHYSILQWKEALDPYSDETWGSIRAGAL